MTLKEHLKIRCLLLVRQQNVNLGNSRLGPASEVEIYIKSNMFFSRLKCLRQRRSAEFHQIKWFSGLRSAPEAHRLNRGEILSQSEDFLVGLSTSALPRWSHPNPFLCKPEVNGNQDSLVTTFT